MATGTISVNDANVYEYFMTAATALASRITVQNGGYRKIGSTVIINYKIKAVATAANSPQVLSDFPAPRIDSALSCIDITNGIGNAIESSIPCGIADNGKLYMKSITTDHIYVITGCYVTAS